MFLLKNKWFWFAIAGAIVIFILWRNWAVIKSKLKQKGGDYQPSSITEERKAELKQLAKELHEAIYGFSTTGTRDTLFERANQLNDNELKFLAKFYKKELANGTSLFTDVDDELLPLLESDDKLMASLQRIQEV